jgi:hypothetical protein
MDTNRALNYKTLLPKETPQYESPTIRFISTSNLLKPIKKIKLLIV